MQHQQLAFAKAIESLPAIWNMLDPTYNDMDCVNESLDELRKAHMKIFELPEMKPIEDVQKLSQEMFEKSKMAMFDSFKKLGFPCGEMCILHYFLKLGAHMDKQCSYASAMLFTSESDRYEMELVRKMTGLKLIVHENGDKSVRYSDGSIYDMKTVPMGIIKLKLLGELERYPEYIERRMAENNTRMGAWMLMREKEIAFKLFDEILPVQDE